MVDFKLVDVDDDELEDEVEAAILSARIPRIKIVQDPSAAYFSRYKIKTVLLIYILVYYT